MAAPAATAKPNAFILNPKPATTLSSSPATNTRLPISLRQPLWRTTTSNATNIAAAARVPLVSTGVDEEAAGDFIRRLQNGPDVRGVALEGEKGRAVDLTPQVVEAIAECFGEWVAERKAGSGSLVRLSVGRDPRVSGPTLSAAVFAGLRRANCEVFDMGLATTPACFMSTLLPPFAYDASIMIIVNSGNGSGGFFTWDVLEKLGADTTGSLHLEPDGMFPNHIPNPEDPTAMHLTVEAVLSHGADLGIVFDTDVDRSGFVDRSGRAVNGDRLIALMSAIVLRERPGTTVVTDARTSVSLTRFITAAGGRHCMYRVGYRNVIDKGMQLNRDGLETHLMMETTGHGALKENYFLDDGRETPRMGA